MQVVFFKAGWSLGIGQCFHNQSTAWYFALKFDIVQPLAIIRAYQRARWLVSPYRDQRLLVSRDIMRSVGGYVELPLMEDGAVVQRLKRRLNALPLTLSTNSGGS